MGVYWVPAGTENLVESPCVAEPLSGNLDLVDEQTAKVQVASVAERHFAHDGAEVPPDVSKSSGDPKKLGHPPVNADFRLWCGNGRRLDSSRRRASRRLATFRSRTISAEHVSSKLAGSGTAPIIRNCRV